MTNCSSSGDGLREGVSRAISQACVYSMEARKTISQVSQFTQVGLPRSLPLSNIVQGMITSSITSGVVFGTYFSIYNRLPDSIFAGTIASVATSCIKIPISNGMRVMQSGYSPSLIGATRKIVRTQSWRGLYTGYRLSLLEDIIEFDLRTRLYRMGEQKHRGLDMPPLLRGLSWGALSGAIAAGITTPFDTLRSHMAHVATQSAKPLEIQEAFGHAWKKGGIAALYTGAPLRVMSNAVKSALFFATYELLPITL